jgi:quinol monooxygenase YgiN
MNPMQTDLYVISPTTGDRHVLYAPQTNVVFFWGIEEDAFRAKQDEFCTAIELSDGCLGYIWGEIQNPVISDKSGYAALGKGGVMISGWKSREEHDRDVAKPRVTEAYKAVSAMVKKTDTWGMQVSIVENNGHFHKWQRLSSTDVTKLDHEKKPMN